MMVLLVVADHGPDLRDDLRQHFRILPEDTPGGFAAQELEQFLPDPFPGDPGKVRSHFPQGGGGGRLNGKIIDGGETQGPENAQGVLIEAFFRFADAADEAGGQVSLSVKGIRKTGFGIPGHGIDGEIPPGQVFRQVVHKVDRVRMTVVGIVPVDPVGGYLIGNMIHHNGQCAVLQAGFHGMKIMKDFLHLLRQGGGTDIPVMGLQTQHGIPDAAADHISREAGFIQPAEQDGDGSGKLQKQFTIHNSHRFNSEFRIKNSELILDAAAECLQNIIALQSNSSQE